MHIIQIANDVDKKRITRNILEELPEWFGIPEAREEYIRDSAGRTFFCAEENEKAVGFLYLKQTGKDTVELAVMGVLKEYHRKGIGKALFKCAKDSLKESGYSFINTILLPHLGHFPTRGPERLVGICTPYRYKFPVGARDLFSFLEAVSSISNNLSPFPLVTCNFPNLKKRLIELFPPVK